MKRLTITLISGGLFFSPFLKADNVESYLQSHEMFLKLPTSNDEAQAWAVCAASLDIMSELLEESKPNTALQLNNLSNGADVSVMMSQVMRLMNEKGEDIDPDELMATIRYGKMQMDELPAVQKAFILSDMELNGAEAMFRKLNSTVEVCAQNNELQKLYVDLMRDFAKSGLF